MSLIEFRHFKKSFRDHTVHHDVNFTVNAGECLGLIGGSGQGKSIILRSLIGLHKPDSGEIFVDGEEITAWPEIHLIELRKKVAYVFQNGALFDSMSVYENLAYPLREHTKFNEAEICARIFEELEEFGLAGVEDKFPAELSGGMQKRVGLARSIILDPTIVLYDEPTAGLDPFNTLKIQEMIIDLKKKGTTSIFVTHDMPSAFAVCDRMALVQDGRIAAVSTIEEMKNEPNSLISSFIAGKTG